MTVPEASVHKNDRLMSRQNDIGPTWQLGLMKAEAEAESVQNRTNEQLRFRVAASDARHIPAAMFAREPIHQSVKPLFFRMPQTIRAILFASNGGTALPTWTHCADRVPRNR